MTVTADVRTSDLQQLVKQVQAGHEILLTEDNKTVAKIVSTPNQEVAQKRKYDIPGLSGHKVLTPIITQAEIANEMFSRE